MKDSNLADMVKGWFVGDFNPVALRSKDFEVAVKEYKAGDREGKHMHKIATEITVIVKGRVRMNGDLLEEGTIRIIEPGQATDFECLEDTITCVVKVPSAKDDKYLVES